VHLKHFFGQIQTNRANLAHGRLLLGDLNAPPWHIDAVAGASTPSLPREPGEQDLFRSPPTRRASQQGLMCLDGCDQQIGIMWPASVDFVIGDMVLRFLQLDHLAELVGLASLALANDLGRWLEQAEELFFAARVAAEDTCPRLLHHLPDAGRHLIEFLAQALQHQLLQCIHSQSASFPEQSPRRSASPVRPPGSSYPTIGDSLAPICPG
jgi:hypothetical protein